MMVCPTARAMEDIGPGGACAGCVRGAVRRSWFGAVVAMLAMVVPASMAAVRDSEGPVRIPLAPMGYQASTPEFMLSGSSALTVHFVDKDHLLITFAVRRLMKREAGDTAGDEDRTVGAFLVELPSGKVLARTEWRLHDRSQYLWSLGHGRFMLRVRDRLTTFAPMASGDFDDAFREVPLLKIDRHIVAILVSSDDDLLTLETTKWAMGSGEASEGFSTEEAPVQINFYRLTDTSPSLDGLRVSSAGVIRTKTAVALPLTAAGSLEVVEGGKDRWLFNFDEHAGKVHELAEWDTSCFPRPTFVGHSEFVAFGCRGSTDKLDFAGFNLKGEEMWQQNFFDAHVSPTFAFAPAAGRFALGRTIVSTTVDADAFLAAGLVTAQEVRVYQSYDGKQVFKIECSPVERAGGNFALSADGMRLATIRETLVHHGGTKDFDPYTERQAAVEVYSLPPLSKEDMAAVKAAEVLAPEDSGARIDLALARISAAAAASDKAKAASETLQAAPQDVPAPTLAEPGPKAEGVTGANVEAGAGAVGGGEPGGASPAVAGSGAVCSSDATDALRSG